MDRIVADSTPLEAVLLRLEVGMHVVEVCSSLVSWLNHRYRAVRRYLGTKFQGLNRPSNSSKSLFLASERSNPTRGRECNLYCPPITSPLNFNNTLDIDCISPLLLLVLAARLPRKCS